MQRNLNWHSILICRVSFSATPNKYYIKKCYYQTLQILYLKQSYTTGIDQDHPTVTITRPWRLYYSKHNHLVDGSPSPPSSSISLRFFCAFFSSHSSDSSSPCTRRMAFFLNGPRLQAWTISACLCNVSQTHSSIWALSSTEFSETKNQCLIIFKTITDFKINFHVKYMP